ncbi:MAG: NAD(P)H-dependent amine dehydrogenase family protein [Armatimonadota bacterium]
MRVVQYGLGPIGCLMAEMVARREGLELVGAIDIDPEKVSRDVGDVAGLDRPLGVKVSDDAGAVLADTRPDVVLHSTGSYLREVWPQIEAVCTAGANLISTCEELSYPWVRNRDYAQMIDAAAKSHGVTVLGTGVNPGFIMDLMVITLTGLCREVTAVTARRVVNASERRLPLQQKIGAGLSVEEFMKRADAGLVRHVGLPESVDMLAAGLGWELDRVEETIEPVVAKSLVVTRHTRVEPGHAAGVRQVAVGWEGEMRRVMLELEMYVGAPDPGDHLYVEGDRHVGAHIRGVHGDTATAAIAVNAVPFVQSAEPGLVSMKDLPTVSWHTAAWLKRR